MGFSERLIEIIGDMDIPKEDLPKLMEASEESVRRWLSGMGTPNSKYLIGLSKNIWDTHGKELNLNYLVSGRGDKFVTPPPKPHGVAHFYSGGDAGIRVSDALVAASRVLDSGTSYATALFLNIQHFDRAVQAENQISDLIKENLELKDRTLELEKKCDDFEKKNNNLEDRLEALEKKLSEGPYGKDQTQDGDDLVTTAANPGERAVA